MGARAWIGGFVSFVIGMINLVKGPRPVDHLIGAGLVLLGVALVLLELFVDTRRAPARARRRARWNPFDYVPPEQRRLARWRHRRDRGS